MVKGIMMTLNKARTVRRCRRCLERVMCGGDAHLLPASHAAKLVGNYRWINLSPTQLTLAPIPDNGCGPVRPVDTYYSEEPE